MVAACETGTGYNPAASPTAQPSKCAPAPCLLDEGGLELLITGVDRQPKLAPGFTQNTGVYPVVIDVKWVFTGTDSETPLTGQVYLIGADKLVVGQYIDTNGGLPQCADYNTPEMATGASFGPKPICFLLAVPAMGPLTLRWRHGLFGGDDQDLVL